MLSVNESYELLNSFSSSENYTKEEAIILKDLLTGLADIAFNAFNQQEETILHEENKLRRKNSFNIQQS